MKHLNRFKDLNSSPKEIIKEQYTEKDFTPFKMRAEAPGDVITFLDMVKYLVSEYHVVTDLSGNGISVEFKSRETLNNLLEVAYNIEDGHLMYRTLNHSADYDGSVIRE